MKKKPIQDMRAFNRWYTDVIGLLNRHLLDSNYNLSEARLIYELHKAGTIQASQVMGLMHIDKSYLSRMLKRLEKEKLVSRKQSREDGRAVLLSLTEKGQREFAQLNGASDEQIASLVSHLDDRQRDALVEHMGAIRRMMGGSMEEAVERAAAASQAGDGEIPPGDGRGRTEDGAIRMRGSVMRTGEVAILPEHIAIRTKLEPGDLGYIAYLHGRIYENENQYGLSFESYVLEGLGEFGARYDPGKDRVWVCEHGREKVGFLVGVNRGEALQLRYFILLPEYRGIGLGKRLMDLFMEFVRERGYRKAYLWTTNEQHAAISLYSRYGFRLTEEKESMAFDKPLIERKYEWGV